jgi:hypothetical protein
MPKEVPGIDGIAVLRDGGLHRVVSKSSRRDGPLTFLIGSRDYFFGRNKKEIGILSEVVFFPSHPTVLDPNHCSLKTAGEVVTEKGQVPAFYIVSRNGDAFLKIEPEY